MMDLFFMEFLIKERQQQILDDFKRIQISRAVNNHKVGIFKKFILGLSEVLIAMGIRLQKRYRPSIKPAISDHDSCSTKGQKYPKASRHKA